jgi:hypothetical protein
MKAKFARQVKAGEEGILLHLSYREALVLKALMANVGYQASNNAGSLDVCEALAAIGNGLLGLHIPYVPSIFTLISVHNHCNQHLLHKEEQWQTMLS